MILFASRCAVKINTDIFLPNDRRGNSERGQKKMRQIFAAAAFVPAVPEAKRFVFRIEASVSREIASGTEIDLQDFDL